MSSTIKVSIGTVHLTTTHADGTETRPHIKAMTVHKKLVRGSWVDVVKKKRKRKLV